MRRRLAPAAAAAAILLMGVSLSGCIVVFPAKTAVTTDPRAGSLDYLPVIAFEEHDEPTGSINCSSGAQTATVYVPQLTRSVILDLDLFLTSVSSPLPFNDPRHIDFTVEDGDGVLWADIHLKNNDTVRKVTIEGPRPGGWTVSLVWNICGNDFGVRVNDHLHVIVIVNQPV